MARTLLVTNDFPPRPGGIQQFVHNLAVRQPAGSVVVYASTWRGADDVRRRAAVRGGPRDTGVLLPTPAVARRAAELARAYDCDTVWFGAAAPLGLLADGLRRRGRHRRRAVALTHGHEVGWAALPGARQLLRRIARGNDVVTYLGEYTAGPARPGAARAHRRCNGSRPAWTSTRTTRGRRRPVRARHGLDRPAGRSSACPGWCPARARTC